MIRPLPETSARQDVTPTCYALCAGTGMSVFSAIETKVWKGPGGVSPCATAVAKDSELSRAVGVSPHTDAHSSRHPPGPRNCRDFGGEDRGCAQGLPPASIRAKRFAGSVESRRQNPKMTIAIDRAAGHFSASEAAHF